MITLRKEDCEGLLIDKEQISFIEILTKHINEHKHQPEHVTQHWIGYPHLRPDTRQNQ